MHPETKKLTQKNMPYLSLTENLKLQLSPSLVASYDIQPGNRVGLFWDKHTHVYLLTYLPRTNLLQLKLSNKNAFPILLVWSITQP